jgi:hypothetical protein
MKEVVKITRTGITADVTANMTRKEMAEKYGISVQRVAKVLAQAGMKGVRVQNPGFIFIDDTLPETPEVTRVESVTNDGPNYAGMAQM